MKTNKNEQFETSHPISCSKWVWYRQKFSNINRVKHKSNHHFISEYANEIQSMSNLRMNYKKDKIKPFIVLFLGLNCISCISLKQKNEIRQLLQNFRLNVNEDFPTQENQKLVLNY